MAYEPAVSSQLFNTRVLTNHPASLGLSSASLAHNDQRDRLLTHPDAVTGRRP